MLDIGSGTGFYVDQWHGSACRMVTGLDITDKAVESTRWPTGSPATPSCARTWAASWSHDVPARRRTTLTPSPRWTSSSTSWTTRQYARAFTNIASRLRPGGWFLWSDNFLRHRTERVTHQASRTLGESERLVKAAGFEIVRRVPMFVVMNYPADTRGKVARWAWTAMVAPAALAEPLGWTVGRPLAPIDRWLTRWVRESPTTEIMVCRKRAGADGSGRE